VFICVHWWFKSSDGFTPGTISLTGILERSHHEHQVNAGNRSVSSIDTGDESSPVYLSMLPRVPRKPVSHTNV
jgi:hypothetical protein